MAALLRALRAPGSLLGRRVLITGASGGVGRFAVRLASIAGAHVIACVGSAARGEGLDKVGADEVVVGLDGIDTPVDVVLDNVGGPQLVAAWQLLAPGGSLQSIGWTSGELAVFPAYSTVGPPKALTSFLIDGPVAEELASLVRLVVPPHREGGQSQYVPRPLRPAAAPSLAPVLAWAQQQLDRPVTVGDLAEQAAMAPRTFARRFRDETGTTPHRWLVQQRLHEAQQRLESTSDDIGRIARETGFVTAETLRHHFRRAFGTSPTSYRRRFRNAPA